MVTVVGRDRAGEWWKICCVNSSDVWISTSVVEVQGPMYAVAEVINVPPPPPVPPTAAPTPTPAPTPTYAWAFRMEGTPEQFTLNRNIFMIAARIYDGATPLYGYKLKIRKRSTGQEWLSNGSDAFYTFEQVEWPGSVYKDMKDISKLRNVKWDSNAVMVPAGDDDWEVRVTDGAGVPLSAPVVLHSTSTDTKWFWVVFTSR
jgi:hypothetical protein